MRFEIDLVIVDLYPFEATVASGAEEPAIIEKIDIGGISLIRAAAKNYNDVVIVASQAQYQPLSRYADGARSYHFTRRTPLVCQRGVCRIFSLRFGYLQLFRWRRRVCFPVSPPTIKRLCGMVRTRIRKVISMVTDAMFDQIHGKEISYNNLLDINAAVDLIDEFADYYFRYTEA